MLCRCCRPRARIFVRTQPDKQAFSNNKNIIDQLNTKCINKISIQLNFNSNNHFVFKRALSSSWHAWRMWWEHLSESEKGSTSCRCSAVIEGHAAAAECGELKVTIYRLVKWDRDGCRAEARHAVQMKCEESSKWKYSFSPSQAVGELSTLISSKMARTMFAIRIFPHSLPLLGFTLSHSAALSIEKMLEIEFSPRFSQIFKPFFLCELRLARLQSSPEKLSTTNSFLLLFFGASGEITTKNSHLCSSGFRSRSQWWRRSKHKSVKKDKNKYNSKQKN